MGIASDFLEAAKECQGQVLQQALRERMERGEFPPVAEEFTCIRCGRRFTTAKGLTRHVFDDHKPTIAVLEVNGRLVHDEVECHGVISALKVRVCGPSATMRVELDLGTTPIVLEGHRAGELTPHVVRHMEGVIRIRVLLPGTKPADFRIFHRRPPEFRVDRLESLAAYLSEDLELGTFDPILWERRLREGSKGELEERFENGLLEFGLGHQKLRDSDSRGAARHLESAFGYLSPFRTPLANLARFTLGVKMNAFGPLSEAPETSIFSRPREFFLSPYGSTSPATRVSGQRSKSGIYVDPATEAVLSCVAAFYEGGTHELRKWMMILEAKVEASRDKNDAEKFHLLGARTARREGIVEEARVHYREVGGLFAEEADAFLSGGKA